MLGSDSGGEPVTMGEGREERGEAPADEGFELAPRNATPQ